MHNFCDKMTDLVNEGRVEDIVYLDFSKAFTQCLLDSYRKADKYRLDKKTEVD